MLQWSLLDLKNTTSSYWFWHMLLASGHNKNQQHFSKQSWDELLSRTVCLHLIKVWPSSFKTRFGTLFCVFYVSSPWQCDWMYMFFSFATASALPTSVSTTPQSTQLKLRRYSAPWASSSPSSQASRTGSSRLPRSTLPPDWGMHSRTFLTRWGSPQTLHPLSLPF